MARIHVVSLWLERFQVKNMKIMSHSSSTLKNSIYWGYIVHGRTEDVGPNPGKGHNWMDTHGLPNIFKSCFPKTKSSETWPDEWEPAKTVCRKCCAVAAATASLPSPWDLRLGWRSSWEWNQSFLRKINKEKIVRLLFSQVFTWDK